MPPTIRILPLPPPTHLWPPLQPGDEVEFSTDSRWSSPLRRGDVVNIQRRGYFMVDTHYEAPPRGRPRIGEPPRPKDGSRHKRFWYPQINNIRRVYRDGKEVARRPGLVEAPVPKYVPPTERTPDRFLFPMTPPPGVVLPDPATVRYLRGDRISFDGRGGAIFEGEVEMVIDLPPSVADEPEIRVKRPGVSTRSCPRLSKVRRVWRNGELVALRGDLVDAAD